MPEFSLATPEQMADIFDLRWRVLREAQGRARGTEQDDYDDPAFEHETVQGIVLMASKLVAAGRIHRLEDDPTTLQVRYMAVRPRLTGMSLGSTLLRGLEVAAIDKFPDADLISLNARVTAKNLYTRAGYQQPRAEVFHLYNVPHVAMEKRLADAK
jgi:predicted GNAT family N-acyltransferase